MWKACCIKERLILGEIKLFSSCRSIYLHLLICHSQPALYFVKICVKICVGNQVLAQGTLIRSYCYLACICSNGISPRTSLRDHFHVEFRRVCLILILQSSWWWWWWWWWWASTTMIEIWHWFYKLNLMFVPCFQYIWNAIRFGENCCPRTVWGT
jgi:hypothetical protein